MQLGIGTYTYGWNIGTEEVRPPVPMNESGLIRAAGDAGIKLIQIGDNLPLHAFSSARRMALAEALLQQGIKLELGARRMTATHLRRYILLCAEMGSSLLRFVVDDGNFKPELREIEQIIRSQRTLLQDKKVRLALENHDRHKALELRLLIENLGYEEVGICLDTANSLGAGEGIESVTEMLAPYTFNLHIKDFTIKRLPHQMGFTVEGRPAGKGMLDIAALLGKLQEFKQCNTAILEQWTVPENSMTKTVKKEKQWASVSLEYLKSFFDIQYN